MIIDHAIHSSLISQKIVNYLRPKSLNFGTFSPLIVVRRRTCLSSNFWNEGISYSYFMVKRSYSRHDGRLEFLKDQSLYLKLGGQIKSNSKEISPIQLGYFPYGTVIHNRAKYFVDEILTSWWSLTENNLSKVYGNVLVSSLFGLQKINYTCQGEVVKRLKWVTIEKIVDSSLLNIKDPRFDAKTLSLLLKAVQNFINDPSIVDLALSIDLQANLANAVFTFLSHSFSFQNTILMEKLDDILFHSANLGFIKSPKDDLQGVLTLCYEIFDSPGLSKNIEWLSKCHKLGSAFLIFNSNPGPVFISKYFKAIEKTYSHYKYKERFCVTVLKQSLMLGIKFNAMEFKNYFPFWKSEMIKMMQHLRKGEIDEILKICVEKYYGKLVDIENILSKEILQHFLSRTDSFDIKNIDGYEKITFSGKPSSIKRKSELRMDRAMYSLVCRQLSSRVHCSISTGVLSELPHAAIEWHSEREFAENVAINWWNTIKSNLRDILGYQLTHTLHALMKINEKTNGELNKQFSHFDLHPAEILACFALKDIENVDFTDERFGSLLDALDILLKTGAQGLISSTLSQEISYALNSFFDPSSFYKRAFVHRYHHNVGNLLFSACKLSACKPSEDSLKIIIESCSKNFNNYQFVLDEETSCGHLWNLYKSVHSFIKWNVDADEHHPSFSKFYFCEISKSYFKLSQSDNNARLKSILLESILLLVLKFDKEKEFEDIKLFWQSEIQLGLRTTLTTASIHKFFSIAKENEKFDRLPEIVSKRLFDEFKRRVPFL